MNDFIRTARDLRARADKLENIAAMLPALPLVWFEEDSNGNPVGEAHDPNAAIRETVEALRREAYELEMLDQNIDFLKAASTDFIKALRDADPQAFADAEDGYFEALAAADDARDLY